MTRLTRPLEKLAATAVNGLEVARHGGLRVEKRPSPFDVLATEPVYRLRRYFPDAPTGGPSVLLVPPLMQVAEVWDISPATSAVKMLHERGIDAWVVDFGDPEREPGGGDRTFADHVLAVSDAVRRVREVTGQDVHIGGYSQGGVFCYVAAAYRGCAGVASVFVLGSPLGMPAYGGFLPETLLHEIAALPGTVLARTGLPRWAVAPMFNWSQPHRTVRADVEYLLALHDRDALLPREPQRQFLKRGAWIGWSGPALADVLDMVRDDRITNGGLIIGGRTVGLADLTCPVLLFIGEADVFGPGESVRQIVQAAPKAAVYECVLPVGHFGLPVSSHARKQTWPGVAAWARWCAGDAGDRPELPDYIHRLTQDDVAGSGTGPGAGIVPRLSYGLGVAALSALSVPRTIGRSGWHAATTARDLSRSAIAEAPRLVRLEGMRAGTRISFGSMLDAAARQRADEVAFLFGDRAHTHAAAKRRIDDVVRGMIALGIRRGEHVGVLMDMRPSALAAVAAVNRIGAVGVLLRPGDDIAAQARLGRVARIITDPEHACAATTLGTEVFVLGGGAGARELPPSAVDMERIDPRAVRLPAWYRPNPGLARDLAFVLFSGFGEQLRADRITNGRWAASALAAASAAALTGKDTIYSISPLHHPSGLLLSTAAPVASGARLAVATRFDASTFWSEARRYGATVVPYTRSMLHELLVAEPDAGEQGHAIRLFVGSGLPPALWRRLVDRFDTTGVLELYASTRAGAIIGNVSGRKIGAIGRPLPGTAQIRIAAFDPAQGRLRTGQDGFAAPCGTGEAGMLLAACDPATHAGNEVPLRDVFTRGDAWIATGDLVRTDADGDLWFVDSVAALIETAHGQVWPRTVEDGLGVLDAVDLAACYQVDRDGTTLAVAAVTLVPGGTLDAAAITRAFDLAGVDARPDIVRVIDRMPMTTWFRPSTPDLQAADVRQIGQGGWRLDPRTGRYRQMRRAGTKPAGRVPAPITTPDSTTPDSDPELIPVA